MVISIIKANHIKEYSVQLSFDNGEHGIVDLRDTIFNDHRLIFEPLQKIEYFKQFSLDSWTMVWPNELDLAPEYLYELSNKQAKQPLTGAKNP